MQHRESTVTTPVTAGPIPAAGLRLGRVRGRTVVLAVFAALAAAAGTVVASAERDVWLRFHPAVPPLVGLTVEEAARLMVPLHFGLSVNHSIQDPDAPMGLILRQNPPPGRRLAIGSIVQVTASQGSGVVPHLRGEPVAAAARRLEAVGLRLGKVHTIEDSAPPDTVLEQFTPPGQQIDPNSAVDVLVSGVPSAGPAKPAEPLPPDAQSPIKTPILPFTSGTVPPPPAPRAAVPTAAPAVDARPGPTETQEEGSLRAGAGSGECSTHPERERVEICHQSEGHRGAQPDVHGPEHRLVPAGP